MTMSNIDWRIILEAPFAPTPDETIQIALRLASLGKGEQFYDLGSGDGRVLITASKDFGAVSTGFEAQREMVEETMARIHNAGLESMVIVLERDFFYEDLSKADVVFLYQTPSVLNAIAKKLVRELRFGSRVLSFRYPIKGWIPEICCRDSSKHELFLYRIPPRSLRDSNLGKMTSRYCKSNKVKRENIKISNFNSLRIIVSVFARLSTYT